MWSSVRLDTIYRAYVLCNLWFFSVKSSINHYIVFVSPLTVVCGEIIFIS
jgi:hypothetical protein